ncbi:GIY-YIG nuclease family protein [Mycolicibacter terrae]|uniref:GIY-YIG domain-containing protein n=2 Tax=Mycobacteriaceae TaxID=1762 RepID=A0A1A3P6E5_MYCAS|nr:MULTISPECIES: hypothetical protein [Mycobacteriaceae]OBK28869.1 hypothetical protein A5634_19715 [Mycobacterium asiaticum]RRR45065.1 GIY-YIG nuclease family protein [Mycolicibacter terrae]
MTALHLSMRPLRLVPWMVRAVIPAGHIGTYALRRGGGVTYIGRSDDLRRRLIVHAASDRADFFTYDLHRTSVQAYEVESALFHILAGEVTNQIHPAAPAHSGAICPFCRVVAVAALSERINFRNYPSHAA